MNKKKSQFIAQNGLLFSAFALLGSTFFGFGGFSMQAFSSYVITGHVSRLQMCFLILVGMGLILSGLAYVNQAKKKNLKKANLMILLHLGVSIVFFATSFFGLVSKLTGTGFWEETTFVDIRNALSYNNMTLICFLAIGILQVALSIIFFKTKMLQQHKLLKAAKILALTSGILFLIKTMIDYPIIKEAIFFLSYMLKIPFLNNIVAIVTPLIYLFSQLFITIILLDNQTSL